MNLKHVARRLKDVHTDWVNSIEDKTVQDLARRNTIIAGGALVSLLQGEEPKDYDLYFKNKETTLAIAHYYVNKFNTRETILNKCGYVHRAFVLDGALPLEEQVESIGEKYWKTRMMENITEDRVKIIVRSDGIAQAADVPELRGYIENLEKGDELSEEELDIEKNTTEKKEWGKLEKYRPIFLSTNAITLSEKIQLIIRFYGEIEDIFSTYDFVHCTNSWESSKPDIVNTTTDAVVSILNKQLIYRGSKYPICSIFRMRKFLSRGWTINAGQMMKACMQISNLDLTDIDVLEDQLVGVDTLYFQMFIDHVRQEKEKMEKEGKEFNIDSTYVCSVIDKLF